ncbi:MAG TPA: ATP-binding protein [Thermoanaerobaculia bacterium]|nr:ATP-binding protein [Thermoanaerobaculia bacterium]
MTPATRYLIAVAVTVVALLLTGALPGFLAPMRLFFLWCAVLITAVLGGLGPALLAVAISLIGAAYFIFGPQGSLHVSGADVVRLVLFALFAGGISYAVGLRQRAEERAAALSAKLRADIEVRRRQEERVAFINRASEVLSSSLGVEQTMRNLARLCVPAIGDWCGIDIGTDEGYERLVVEHSDVAKLQLVRELARFRPPPEVDLIAQVIRTGKSQLVEEITDDLLAAATSSPEHLEMVRNLGLRSTIIAPMVARGRTLGALTVVYGESDRRYTREDVPFLEDLGRRAAIAIDNARLYEAAESANRAKDEFLATLSHELRTPLTAISGWAHMLQLGMTDEKTTRLAVDTILRSAKTQGELIDDLLDLSRVVAGTLHLHIVTADLTKIVEDVLVAARPAADAKQLRMEVVARPSVLVRGDDRRLRQIVWNLVSNAVKFTDEGGAVRIELSVHGSSARVDVIDSGRGIDSAFLPYVWDRFRQADSSTSRQHGGLGLGLAVVRHLVELHGGTVSVASPGAGRGATFSVELPLARLGEGTAAKRAGTVVDGRLGGKRVLVVDDDDDARLVLATMLRQAGAEVVTAGSTEQALAVFATDRFDALVSDIAMPGEDGYALVERLRRTSGVPAIAVSAIATGIDDRRRALAAGFTEFVRKPVDPVELAEMVANAIG